MHDPSTVCFDIKWPFGGDVFNGKRFRPTLITIWHVDPETDGSDDSCGWFKRARHGDPIVLKQIKSAFEFDWDAGYGGWFNAAGEPIFTVPGIVLDMFWHAAFAHFGASRRAKRFIRRHLVDILRFAENPTDSMHPSIVGRYGIERREDRIDQAAAIVYGCVLRWTQPWYRHPRWHVWHWRIQIHPLQKLRRRLFVRCEECGKPFGWNESPTGTWGGDRLWHQKCYPMPASSQQRAADDLRKTEPAGTA